MTGQVERKRAVKWNAISHQGLSISSQNKSTYDAVEKLTLNILNASSLLKEKEIRWLTT